jgi:hypothetical protein
MDYKELCTKVDELADIGFKQVGCPASPWDYSFYAAQVLFPEAGDDRHRLLADFVQGLVP